MGTDDASLDELEVRIIQRLRQGPASFPQMREEGLFDRSTGETLRSRLTASGLITPVSKVQPEGRGRPRTVYALTSTVPKHEA